ncbi:hypothetical protein C8N46_10266 [Kordia periserrulae]|uniref:Uncharacterized protein n=1 Tax=Kordia periserrulae TaxID=701523 RepID=A0A2T6C2X2_9FLAO|nr:hypothetical protein [Kordia periserrulae]PTX62670.1 hypothetical protein C8N46_10266 [Kordia periserrulae]
MKRIISLSIIGILFAIVLYYSYQFDNLFRIFFFLILGISFSVIFYKTTTGNYTDYQKNKKAISYLPTLIGIGFILLNVGIYYHFENKLNSPSLIKAQNHGVYADFKVNGQYIIKSGSWATKIHQYGTYKLEDNIIIADKLKYDDVLVSNRFLISFIQNSDLTNLLEIESFESGKYLLQIDSSGNEIKNKLLNFDKEHNKIFSSYKFEITEDNRKHSNAGKTENGIMPNN